MNRVKRVYKRLSDPVILCFLISVIAIGACASVDAYVYDGGEDSLITIEFGPVSDSLLTIGHDGMFDSVMIIDYVAAVAPGTYSTGAITTAANYKYYAKIPITNSCTYAVTSRTIITMPAFALVNGNYIQSDADDITVLYEDEEEIMAGNLTSNDAEWVLDYTEIPAQTTIIKTLYWGNPTLGRNQQWICSADDNTYVSDDATLDITTDLGIYANVYIPEAPDAEQIIVSKEGAYEVVVDTTPEIVFRLYGTGGAGYTATGSPNLVASSTLLVN